MQKNNKVISFTGDTHKAEMRLCKNYYEPQKTSAATAFGRKLRKVVVMLMRGASVIGVIAVLIMLAGCAHADHVDHGNGIHTISYTEESAGLGVAPGWYGAVSGRLMDDAAAVCPAGFKTLSTDVKRGDDTTVTWKVKCND
jgi:hypothetical protein